MTLRTPTLAKMALAGLFLAAPALLAQEPAGVPAAPPAPAPEPAPARTFDEYRVLTSQNMFVRDRASLNRTPAPTTQRTTDYRPAPPPTPPHRFLVLSGTILADLEAMAQVEDLRTGRATLYRTGDRVGPVTFVSVTLDSVEVELDGERISVPLAHALDGQLPARSGSASSTPGGAGTSAGRTWGGRDSGTTGGTAPGSGGESGGTGAPAATPPAGDPNDFAERMRLRRLQELGG